MILTYAAEFDRVCYPLPLSFEVEPDAAALSRTVLRLRREVDDLRHVSEENILLKDELRTLSLNGDDGESSSRVVSLAKFNRLLNENEAMRRELSVEKCSDWRLRR